MNLMQDLEAVEPLAWSCDVSRSFYSAPFPSRSLSASGSHGASFLLVLHCLKDKLLSSELPAPPGLLFKFPIRSHCPPLPNGIKVKG